MRRLILLILLAFGTPLYSFIPSSDQSRTGPLFNFLDSCVWSQMDLGNYDRAESQAYRLLQYSKGIRSEYILANAYNTLGTVLSFTGKYPEALENLFIALRHFENLKDELKIANVYSNIGSAYYGQDKFDDALKMFKQAEGYLEKVKYLPGVSAIANNIGLVYSDKHEHRKALEQFIKSYRIDSTMGNDEGVALSYLNFGRCYFDLGELDKAAYNYDKGLVMTDRINDTYTISKLLLNSARIDIIRKNFSDAQRKIDQAFKLGSDEENPAERRDIYTTIHELDSARNDLRAAYHSYRTYIKFRDLVFNEESSQRSAEARVQYEYDRKQAVFKAEQEKKDALADQEKQKAALIRNSLMTGLILVFALAAAIFRGYRNKKKAHEEISSQRDEIVFQKELVEEKNREIVDSINYAKRLQGAILPPVSLFKSAFPESFIFYRPKDIVAGDFYFFESTHEYNFIAAADCTGHGVPGALVSVICSTALSRAVKEFRLIDPGLILDKVTELVIETFEKSENIVSDGMDISLLVIHKNSQQVIAKWSGANNGIYIQKKNENELIEQKGDKQPVGRFENRTSFKTHELTLSKGDRIYLFTDGYADQFGGVKGKKFKYSQLKEMLISCSALSAEHTLKTVDEQFISWKGSHEQTDDVTLIGIEF